MDFTPPFGKWLKLQRVERDLTQSEFALQLGYSPETIRKVEAGILKPSKQLIELLVGWLHIPADQRSEFIAFATNARLSHASRAANNLLKPATALVGRTEDLAAIKRLLLPRQTKLHAPVDTRLVTLVGAPGVGKTRLAIEAAHALVNAIVDGACWVELAPVTEPQTAMATIAEALEIENRPGRPVLRLIQEHLRDRQMLLILDNLEQVLDAAPLIGQILSAAPKVKMICTSRELLRIAGEQGYTVHPLGDEAVQLFAQCAQAIQPDFEITPANAPIISDICRKLDGLPLAIELVAARISLFKPEEMLSRLDQRLNMLTVGLRDLPSRQRTLRTTLDWSYGLLSSDEQKLFCCMGVFTGGCTMALAQMLFEQNTRPVNVIDGVSALMTKNLLLREDRVIDAMHGNPSYFRMPKGNENQIADNAFTEHSSTRYRMLETVHEYAREKLIQAGEFGHWIKAMGECLLRISASAGRNLLDEHGNWLSCMQWLTSNHDKTDLALRLATSGGAFTFNWVEHCRWLEKAINDTGAPEHIESRMSALYMLGNWSGHFGRLERAIPILLEVLDYSRSQGKLKLEKEVLFSLGHTYREMGMADQSRDYFRQALNVACMLQDNISKFHILISVAETEVDADDVHQADTYLQAAESIDIPKYDLMLAWELNHKAHAAQLRGATSMAAALLEESTALFKKSPFQQAWGIAWNRQSLGEIALSNGEIDASVDHLSWSATTFRDMADGMGVSWCLAALAGAHALNNHPERGAKLWGASEALREQIGCRVAPASRPNRERMVKLLREQLGEAEFARLAAEGAKLSLDEAVAFALETQM
jgi:predicted ATPase/DNA-binding XRE family transcriptional regulator